jgi:hypothetical protein
MLEHDCPLRGNRSIERAQSNTLPLPVSSTLLRPFGEIFTGLMAINCLKLLVATVPITTVYETAAIRVIAILAHAQVLFGGP